MVDLIVPAINQSQVQQWRACSRKWMYRYEEKLVPRWLERPLHLGTWGHAALEAFYRDGDWRAGHAPFVEQYDKLFEEERQNLDRSDEPLPSQVERIMRSYVWYYRNDGWKVIAVEQNFEVMFDGIRFKGRIDLIIEDVDGLLWVVDHKWPFAIPEEGTFHAMHPQLVLYPYAAEQTLGLDIAGVIFNYVRAKAPTLPKLNQDGSLSKRAIDTDYPTLFRFLKANDKDPKDFTDILRPLYRESPFLRRYKLPRDAGMTARILAETAVTAREILHHPAGVVRNVTRDCERCPYQRICRGELLGLNMDWLRNRDFQIEEEGTLLDGSTVESEGVVGDGDAP